MKLKLKVKNVLNLDINQYLPHQLIKMLSPIEVEKQFGLTRGTLAYWRTQTKDTGELVGPAFFSDGKVNLYQVKVIIEYMRKHYYSGIENQENLKDQENLKNKNNFKIVKD